MSKVAFRSRLGEAVAATALARKLAGIMLALWKHDTIYEPRRAAMEILQPM
jgi:hypothetical protein